LESREHALKGSKEVREGPAFHQHIVQVHKSLLRSQAS
jgi:hypothetical protein